MLATRSRHIPFSLLRPLALLLAFSHTARADCYYDDFRNRTVCDGLSRGARWGIGVAIFVASIFLIFAISFMLARRRRQRQLVYAQHAAANNPHGGQRFNADGTPMHNTGYNVNYGPSYPPPPGAPPQGQGYPAPPPPAYSGPDGQSKV